MNTAPRTGTSPLNPLRALFPGREFEARFQHALEQTNSAVFVVAPRTGQLLTINTRATALTGLTREEFLKQSLSEVVQTPEALSQFYTLEPGSVRAMSGVALRTRTGQILVDLRLSALKESREAVVLAFASPMEERLIQERDRAQASHALNTLDHLLDLFEAPTPETLQRAVEIARRILSADAAGLFRARPDVLQLEYGDSVPDAFPHRIGPSEARHLQRPLVWAGAQRAEGFLPPAFRAAGWSHVLAHPLGKAPAITGALLAAYRPGNPPAAQMPQFLAVVARQITHLIAQIGRQAKLNDAQRLALHLTHQLAAVNAQIGEGVITLNAHGLVDDVNGAAAQMFGYRAVDVVGLPFGDVLAADEALHHLIETALRGQPAHEREGHMHRRSGEAFPVLLRVQPLASPDGGAVLTLHDLARARADEIRREHLDQLAYVGQSTSSFAHEVRAPLNNISMGVQYLAARIPAEAELQPYLTKIQAECTRLSQLMNDMLAWAKPVDPKLEAADLPSVLKRLLNRWSAKLQQRNVAHTLTAAEACPPVLADSRLLERVFINLIENALQAMPAGGHLAISTQAVQHDGRGVNVETRVSDSGPGIPDDIRKRIFDPYFTTRADGTGLGLAICKRIVTIHHGAISVESFPGTGTIFTITLPAHLEETVNHAEHEETRSSQSSS